MMDTQWFRTEDEQGEEEMVIYAAVTDRFYADFIDSEYTGVWPSVHIEFSFTLHEYFDRPHQVGCKDRTEAIKNFSGWQEVSHAEINVPAKYRALLRAFEEIFINHNYKFGDKSS